MAIPHARRMNLVALALLITALIAFVAFHFLVVEYESDPMVEHEMGWGIWPSLFRFLKSADFSDPEGMIAAASFLCESLLIVLTPFLIPALKKSRLMWWVVVIPAGMATCGFGGIVVMGFLHAASSFGPAIPCLLGALALNFIGLVFIRREATPGHVEEPST